MSENIQITITDDGETIVAQVNEAARGPAGSAASVTNTNVNTAIETDPAATRASLELPKNNYAASTAPTATDDEDAGYEIGSQWTVSDDGNSYTCLDATSDNAVWAVTTLDSAEVAGMIATAANPYGFGAFSGTTTLDRLNGQFQYGKLTGNCTFFAPTNASEGQQISITFETTGTWTLNFTDIQFDFDTTGLLPITLEANKTYSLDMRVKGYYWTFEAITGATNINATIDPALTLVYDANSFITSYAETTIPVEFMQGRSDILDIVIGGNVTTISNKAFLGCSGITGGLFIPDSVTTMGIRAFSGCSGYAGSLTISDNLTKIERGCFRDCSGFVGALTLPSGLTYIADNAFRGVADMSSDLTIPATVTEIGASAFRDMTSIGNDLIISATTIAIGTNAFNGCAAITNINAQCPLTSFGNNSLLGSGVTTIHARAADTSWTAGAGLTIAGKTGITVTKDL